MGLYIKRRGTPTSNCTGGMFSNPTGDAEPGQPPSATVGGSHPQGSRGRCQLPWRRPQLIACAKTSSTSRHLELDQPADASFGPHHTSWRPIERMRKFSSQQPQTWASQEKGARHYNHSTASGVTCQMATGTNLHKVLLTTGRGVP